jgi:hypothetical protein
VKNRAVLFSVVGLLLVLLGAAYVVLFAPDSTPGVRGLSPAGPAFSDTQGLIDPGPYDAAFSPNGARLAVLSAGGVSLAEGGRLTKVVKQEATAASRVVAMAWMPTSDRLLVAEGPAQTRRLNVVDLKGQVVAAATLDKPLSLGDGFGMAVDATNRRAVLVNVTRDAIGGRRHLDLAVVDLQTGAVGILPTPDADESRPYFVDDSHVLVTQDAAQGTGAVLYDLKTRTASPLAEGATAAAGVLSDSGTPVYQTLAEKPSVRTARGELGRLDEGATLVAVHPAGAAAVERLASDSATGARLKVISLHPPKR